MCKNLGIGSVGIWVGWCFYSFIGSTTCLMWIMAIHTFTGAESEQTFDRQEDNWHTGEKRP